jgi:hypothetical protein
MKYHIKKWREYDFRDIGAVLDRLISEELGGVLGDSEGYRDSFKIVVAAYLMGLELGGTIPEEVMDAHNKQFEQKASLADAKAFLLKFPNCYNLPPDFSAEILHVQLKPE